MKFLMISKYAEGAHRLFRIKQSGNEVALYIEDKDYKHTWEGILPRVGKDWENFIDSDTTVLFDQSGFGKIVDYLRRKSVSTWGGSELADKLEERVYGIEYAKKWGINTPDYFEFSTVKEAIKFLQANRLERFVFKPEGDNLPCRLTYCEEDLIGFLEDFVEPNYSSKIKNIVLQQFIEGVDVSTEAWISNGKVVSPINRTLEVKNFMNDDKGPMTGGVGNIVWICEEDKIYKDGLAKVAETFAFYQQLDVNGVIDYDGKFWFLEFTPRDGYPATPTLLHLMNEDLGELYYKLARGEQKEINISNEIAGAVFISVPPYPVEMPSGHAEELTPIKGLPSPLILDNYYFYEIKLTKEKHLVHSGESGAVGLIFGTGYSPEECFELPYKILEDAQIPELQYRTDLVKVFDEELEKLELHDYSYR